jgi:integrase/recombinase XerD
MKAYLDPEEIQNLENAAQFLRDKILIRILFYLGCRIGEAIDLDVKDINFDACTITILHLKLHINIACPECKARLSKSHTFCPGCGIKVNEAVAKEMEHRKAHHGKRLPNGLVAISRFRSIYPDWFLVRDLG